MRQNISHAIRRGGVAAALIMALLMTLWPAAAWAKDHPQITLSANTGMVDTDITITGKSFPAFCAGVIFIDDNATDTVYTCDNNGAFQTQLTWPDGLNDGKHTISARGAFSSAQTTFTQITATATPDGDAATATAGVVATATASAAANATATAGAAQSTATAQAPTATTMTGGAAGGTSTTPPPASKGLPGGMLALILVASLLLIAGGVLLALALSNRRRGTQGLPAHAYRPVPPPPPPTDATLPQGDQWIWPNDPYHR